MAAVLGLAADPPASYQRYVDAVTEMPASPVVRTDAAVSVPETEERRVHFKQRLSPEQRELVAYLPDECFELLREAGRDRSGYVMVSEHMGGMSIETNERNFVEEGNPRSEAKWRRVVRELMTRGLLEQTDSNGEIFRVTDSGYQVLDLLKES
jgi:hypothetical protein